MQANRATRISQSLQGFADMLMGYSQMMQQRKQQEFENNLATQKTNMLAPQVKDTNVGPRDYNVVSRIPNMNQRLPYAGYNAIEAGLAQPGGGSSAQSKPLAGKAGELQYWIKALGMSPDAVFERMYPVKEPKTKTPKDYPLEAAMKRIGQSRTTTDAFGNRNTAPIGVGEATAAADSLRNYLQIGNTGGKKYPGLTPDEAAEYEQLMRELGGR